MEYDVFKLISDCGLLSSFIPFITLFILMNKIHRGMWWILFSIIFVWILCDCLCWILARESINTIVIVNIYDTVSTCLYILLFYSLNENKSFRLGLVILATSYVLFAVTTITLMQSWFLPQPIVGLITILIPVVLSILFFYELLKNLKVDNLFKYPYYWIACAILFRFGMVFFTVIFTELIYLDMEVYKYIWLIVIFSSIIYNLLITKGIWLMRRT